MWMDRQAKINRAPWGPNEADGEMIRSDQFSYHVGTG